MSTERNTSGTFVLLFSQYFKFASVFKNHANDASI